MKLRFAFIGFRHPHILSLWKGVKNHSNCEIVAACEEDAGTRKALAEIGQVTITHESFEHMLSEVACDVVAIGDIYAKRGSRCIRALETGHHILSDKPICTEKRELERIRTLALEKGLSVGCQLDLVEFPAMRRLRDIISTNLLGRICTVTILAQHPLRLESREPWYFEPGAHGGTINDIGIHVFDLVPWLTGQPWTSLLNARQWNAQAPLIPHFKDGAQVYGILGGDISCFADISYLAPDVLGYEISNYWRVTVHGTKGMAETNLPKGYATLVQDKAKAPEELPGLSSPPLQYLEDFLEEITGKPVPNGMTTSRCLLASHLALAAQAEAEREESRMPL